MLYQTNSLEEKSYLVLSAVLHYCLHCKTLFQIRDSNCNYEAFMNIIKLSDNIGELEAVKDKASEELQYLRSLDTAGDG